jgi:hypothetical protein
MKHRGLSETTIPVALSTTAAVHRRDHAHEGETCRPHVVEVVGLGSNAIVVCHDCATDTGFMESRRAAEVAERHKRLTA